MCDTIAATGARTATGGVLFGKNSDRLRDEAQAVEIVPAAEHSGDADLRCTYIAVPQARRTHRLLICRPWWMWGAEMGVNQHGVAIGNEAVFARTPASRTPALLGMDLVRLGLERAASAAEAVEVITWHLEAFGQGGNCAASGEQHYDNSFLIADRRQAYVLETVGRDWALEPVAGARAISNLFTIAGPSRASPGLAALLDGLSDGAGAGLADRLGDPDQRQSGASRWARSSARLGTGDLRAADFMSILRDHGEEPETGPAWRPSGPKRPRICAHATEAEPRGQTVGSLVCDLAPARDLHWVTASSSPCVSVFKPVLLDRPLPVFGLSPGGPPDPTGFWWRHEALRHRLLDQGLGDIGALRRERDALERRFADRMAEALRDGDPDGCDAAIAACWREAMAAEERWSDGLQTGDRVA